MKKTWKKAVLAAAAVAVLAVGVLLFVNRGKEVEVAEVSFGSIVRQVVDTGCVQAAASYDLQAAHSARVTEVLAETGQAVRRGEVLVLAENLDLAQQIGDTRSQMGQAAGEVEGAKAAVERARLECDDAQRNFDRLKGLYEAGAVARAELEKAQLQLESCRQVLVERTSLLQSAQTRQAGLSLVLEQLLAKERQLAVKSPADGVVLDIPVKSGHVIQPGELVAKVAAVDKLEVRVDILADDMAEVRVGQKAAVTSPVLGEAALTGEVVKIYPRAEEKQSPLGITQRRVPVIVALDGAAGLKPGYEVRVAITVLVKEGVLILPREAVRTVSGGQKEVTAVAAGRTRRQAVQTGLCDRNNVEITAGLSVGDLVVRDAGLDLPDGTKLKVKHQVPGTVR